MTEAEWLACHSPKAMLEFLRARVGPRKLRLFAVACCRRVRPLLTDPRSRAAVEVVERYADGRASPEEVHDAYQPARAAARAAWAAVDVAGGDPDAVAAAHKAAEAARAAAEAACEESAVAAAAVAVAAGCTSYAGDPALKDYVAAEHRAQCRLLRCVVGNPFRPASVDPTWLAADGGAAVELAHRIYQERAFGRLPDLARALEAAGCADPEILTHCRSGGEHVRGCWVVDLILSKDR
jgi:hypothetical protein